jgi:hypothetical protein
MNRQADFLVFARNVDPFKLSAFFKFLTTFFGIKKAIVRQGSKIKG